MTRPGVQPGSTPTSGCPRDVPSRRRSVNVAPLAGPAAGTDPVIENSGPSACSLLVLVLGSGSSWSITLHGNLLKCSQPHHSSKGFVSLSINPSFEEFIAQLVFITLRWELPYKISDQKHFFSLANTKYHLKQIFVSKFRLLVKATLFPDCFRCAAQNFSVKICWI